MLDDGVALDKSANHCCHALDCLPLCGIIECLDGKVTLVLEMTTSKVSKDDIENRLLVVSGDGLQKRMQGRPQGSFTKDQCIVNFGDEDI